MREAGHESQDDGNHVDEEWCHLLPSMISGGRSDDGTAQVAVLQHHHQVGGRTCDARLSCTLNYILYAVLKQTQRFRFCYSERFTLNLVPYYLKT